MEERKLLIEFKENGNIDCNILNMNIRDLAMMLYSVSSSLPEFKVALMAVAKTLIEESGRADDFKI